MIFRPMYRACVYCNGTANIKDPLEEDPMHIKITNIRAPDCVHYAHMSIRRSDEQPTSVRSLTKQKPNVGNHTTMRLSQAQTNWDGTERKKVPWFSIILNGDTKQLSLGRNLVC